MDQVRNVTLEDPTGSSLLYSLCLSCISLSCAATCCHSLDQPVACRLLGQAKVLCFVKSHCGGGGKGRVKTDS